MRRFVNLFMKNAVNALLTNAGLITIFHSWKQLNTRHEWAIVGEMALTCVAVREGTFWFPKLLAWSQSECNNETTAEEHK